MEDVSAWVFTDVNEGTTIGGPIFLVGCVLGVFATMVFALRGQVAQFLRSTPNSISARVTYALLVAAAVALVGTAIFQSKLVEYQNTRVLFLRQPELSTEKDVIHLLGYVEFVTVPLLLSPK